MKHRQTFNSTLLSPIVPLTTYYPFCTYPFPSHVHHNPTTTNLYQISLSFTIPLIAFAT